MVLEREKIETKLKLDAQKMEIEKMRLELKLQKRNMENDFRAAQDAAEKEKVNNELEMLKLQLEKEKNRRVSGSQEKAAVVNSKTAPETSLEASSIVTDRGATNVSNLAASVASSITAGDNHVPAIVNGEWKIPSVDVGDTIPCQYCVETNEYTSISMAAFYGHKECLCALLDSGADFLATGADGQTPVHYSAAVGNFDCLESLISYGADTSTLDSNGRTALFLAAASNQFHCVATLVGVMEEYIDFPDFRGGQFLSILKNIV